MSVFLVQAHPLAAGPWSIGAYASSVVAALGPPSRVYGENLVYAIDPQHRTTKDAVTFEISAGRVRAVTWNWDVD